MITAPIRTDRLYIVFYCTAVHATPPVTEGIPLHFRHSLVKRPRARITGACSRQLASVIPNPTRDVTSERHSVSGDRRCVGEPAAAVGVCRFGRESHADMGKARALILLCAAVGEFHQKSYEHTCRSIYRQISPTAA